MTLPRFSLRLLLVAMAVLCAWLAWERSVVMQRRAVRETFGSREIGWATPAIDEPPATVPLFRRLFGDEAIHHLWFPPDYTDQQIAEVSSLFPEANVDRWATRLPSGGYIRNVPASPRPNPAPLPSP